MHSLASRSSAAIIALVVVGVVGVHGCSEEAADAPAIDDVDPASDPPPDPADANESEPLQSLWEGRTIACPSQAVDSIATLAQCRERCEHDARCTGVTYGPETRACSYLTETCRQGSSTPVADCGAATCSYNRAPSGRPQFGFAHRVNDRDEIEPALSIGVTGIEFDICETGGVWWVSHNDFGVCRMPNTESLAQWTERLSSLLQANAAYRDRLVMLWVDIKTPGDSRLMEVVDTLHAAGLPADLNILYDLQSFDAGRTGYAVIRPRLRDNEGISFTVPDRNGDIDRIHDLYRTTQFTRGTLNHGHSLDIDEDILADAHRFRDPADPYRFKLVLTWTNLSESAMRDYVNPVNRYHTDGQIVGAWWQQWNGAAPLFPAAWRRLEGVVASDPDTRMVTKADLIWSGYCLDPHAHEGLACAADGDDTSCPSHLTCGLSEAGSDNYVCCGHSALYAGHDYCTSLIEGKRCWADAHCASGFCAGNTGGLTTGTCKTRHATLVGGGCSGNAECQNGTCGRDSAAVGAPLICCPSGRLANYAGFDYCTGLARGATCWSDAHCASDSCAGNLGGLRKGTCE